MGSARLFVEAFISLIAILNPISAAPIFLGLTQGQTVRERAQIARTTAIAATVILLISAIAGKWILFFFGISLPSFRVAGGILIVLIGLDMLNARPSRSRETPEETAEAQSRKEIAVVPMACPQLAGPGSISFVIMFAAKGSGMIEMASLIGIIFLAGIASYLTLLLASPLGNALGRTGMNIMTRIMGLLLVAVAVEFVITGVKAMWIG